MAFGKTVLAEAADLLEDALGEFGGDALRLHARDQPLAVALDPSGAMPRRHVAAQLVGFARRIVGGDHRQAHHLFLKQRHAERFFEHRFQQMDGDTRPLLCPGAGANKDAPCRR